LNITPELTRKQFAHYFARLSLVVCVVLTASCESRDPRDSPSANQLQVTKQNGDAIIDALYAYKAKMGFFPRSRSDVVPAFVPEIREPLFGKWAYSPTESGSHFVLSFGGDAAPDSGCPEHWSSSRHPKEWFGY
jgi:hypothetical protein